ncbi:MAG: alkaline phosphatase family protein [Planctomycetota bacterium]|nr:alkaline phosphatase family protein [Planctomycetota bacterium]MDA1211783.1 alkaline phosphatase family protein [Planctomycetota bacterium]
MKARPMSSDTHVVLLSIPALRDGDLVHMPRLNSLADVGGKRPLIPSFPAVTCPVQATLTTGVGPEQHGVVANGFYWRDKGQVEMWTAWNKEIQAPQIWEKLSQHDKTLTSAVWFPLLSKGAKADYICTPAPIHNPDGSESLWCYTVPTEMYGELRDALGHFPLMNFWGPLSNIKSTTWIVDSAIWAAEKHNPRFSYIYLPHLDYAAQKFGPDSDQAVAALGELDATIGKLIDGYATAGLDNVTWVAASEYAITPVSQVGYPNRTLREAGMLALRDDTGTEQLIPGECTAFAMVDHQLAHVFVNDVTKIDDVAKLFTNDPAVERVLVGKDRHTVGLDHPQSGEVVLIAKPEAWFAYYWWLDDAKAPAFARTVDIHRKPGYDPVEMFINMPARSTPLDATLVKGSHGYPADDASRETVLVSSNADALKEFDVCRDVDIAGMILNMFGVT